jgi:hypothetical protein
MRLGRVGGNQIADTLDQIGTDGQIRYRVRRFQMKLQFNGRIERRVGSIQRNSRSVRLEQIAQERDRHGGLVPRKESQLIAAQRRHG